VIPAAEIRKRLHEAIERHGRSREFERIGKAAIDSVIPDILRIILEEVRAAKK
jgi:hypothetical protein